MRYSKEALKAALRMDNLFYKNLALCDIATGYYFLNRLDSALYYAQAAYDAAIADSLPSQLPHVYTDLGSIYAKMGENGKALEYIDKAIGLRPRKDTLAILGCMPIRWICSGSWGSMTPLPLFSESRCQPEFGNTGRCL